MENEKKAMVVEQLNIDVIAEILSRLPVKDLIRSKSVCKAWLQLITSKDFIKLHLQRSSLRPIPLEDRYLGIDCHRVRTRRPKRSYFCGSSCDGLVCLFNTKQSIIHIWNPALRSSACIPMKKRSPDFIRCFWFGLHNDEYKLVLGTEQLEMHLVRPYIDSCYDWKSAQKLKDGYVNYSEFGTLFNGTVHWPVCKGNYVPIILNETNWKILSYNLHQEKVGEIVIPVVKCSMAKHVRLGEVDGCLSALILYHGTREFELWAMKEYGVEESWAKMMVLNAESEIPVYGIRPKEDVLDDQATIKSPLYRKELYVESLVYPKLNTERSLRSRMKSCQIISSV